MSMRIKKIIRTIRDAVMNPEREFSERIYVGLALISELTVFIALIGDLLCAEYVGEILVIISTLIFVPLLTVFCFKRNKIRLAIRITVACLLLFILPGLFFFGGGVEGGGVLWFIFVFAYVGLVISGIWRVIIGLILSILAAVCYTMEYCHPEWIRTHSRGMTYVDSYISLVLVGVVCVVMTWLQNRLFMDENERAKKEAERAEELTRSQNRFFSSMSHEIRTPINSILGLNELILRDINTSDEVAEDARGIQGAGKMLLALVNDILDFSKIEAGSMDIVPVDYRVGEVLSEVVNMIWLKAEEKGLKFNVNIDPRVPSVLYGDEVRLKQIIINILNNAVKYTVKGSVELHIEKEDVDDKTVELLISISDTGMGIKKEALPYLFDAFKRVDEEKNRYIEGTGLGLSIVKQLVELMDGNIKVNSIYGEGSTFTVSIRQGVSDHTPIGELNIHSRNALVRTIYESSFQAPEARILIVDDNEMNLEVESRLLDGTDIYIDKALNGKEALELSEHNHYDVILMDHLMPEMDGIECLEEIRNQTGNLNRTTPVVVLTANAGSENRDLYNRSGFDGYLVKPVSGASLEEMLIKHIPREKLIVRNKITNMGDDIKTAEGYLGKEPVIITSTSLCDLPDGIVRKLKLSILPFRIKTEEGVFKDYVQMGADELINYLRSGKNAESLPPDETTYTEFFSEALKKAHHLIHIAITSSMSEDYRLSSEAAKAFDNVTVINSGCLSSATGILVLIACKLAQQGFPAADIVEELEVVKHRLRCSFIIDTTEYMARNGHINPKVHSIARSLNLHPCLTFKEDMAGIGGIWAGKIKRAYKHYIKKAFPVDIIPDSDVVFITYADVPLETLIWIREEISKMAYFEHVIFKQASAAISSNCGPGTVGILYFVKSNKSYNISSFIDEVPEEDSDEDAGSGSGNVLPYRSDETDYKEEEDKEEKNGTEEAEEDSYETPSDESEEKAWYQAIEGIDADTAILNSGSEEAFKTVLKIFYDSIPVKYSEIEDYYTSEDWDNYTIKVHALKSSAKLIGAMGFSDEAQLLEDAGKAKDTGYIKEHHEAFMAEYAEYKHRLSGIFEEEAPDKPMADEYLMQGVYEGLREAASAMDCDTMEDILKELEDYTIPESDRDKFKAISEKAAAFDYDGIVKLLDEGSSDKAGE